MTAAVSRFLHGLQNLAAGKTRWSSVHPGGKVLLNMLLVSSMTLMLSPCFQSFHLFFSPVSQSMKQYIYHCGALVLTQMYTFTSFPRKLHSIMRLWAWHWIMYFSIGFACREETRERKTTVSTFKRSQKDNPTFPRIWRKGASKLRLLWLYRVWPWHASSLGDLEMWLPTGEHLSAGAQGRQMDGALIHVALRSHPSSWGHLEMEAVSKASNGRAWCAATGWGARSPRMGLNGRDVLATDHPRPLWGSWCPVEIHAAWPSIHSEKTCSQVGQISNDTNDSFQAKSNKLSMVWFISLFKKINAGIFKSKKENKLQWVFNLCSIHIRKHSAKRSFM